MEDLLNQEVKVVNIGLREFFESLVEQKVEAVQVEWKPPAQGDQELMDILDKLL
jgi:hypothetical protein